MNGKGLLKFFKLDNFTTHLSGYVEDRIELLKLELQEDIVSTITKAIVIMLVIVLGLLALFFASFAIAIMLNSALDTHFGGYLIVAGGYLILTITIFYNKDNEVIKKYLRKLITKKQEK